MSDKQTRAQALIDDFAEHAPARGAFTQIDGNAVVAGLRTRIDSPYTINQGDSSLCGPAAILVEVATDDPERYARFVLDLYAKGEGKIKDLDVRPSADLKGYALPNDGNSPAAADWIPLASLRDSSNWILRYDAVGDQVAGITTPGGLAQWARDMGYTKVSDNTIDDDLLFEAHVTKNLCEAVRHVEDGYHVFLLINASLVQEDPEQWSTYLPTHWGPNHWVVLISGVVTNGSAKLQVYSWGNTWHIPPHGGMVPAALIRTQYFGFVAAKY
jgi:hypothetical protein